MRKTFTGWQVIMSARRDRNLMMLRTDVEADAEEKCNSCYADQHVPPLMTAPGFGSYGIDDHEGEAP